MKRAKLIEHTIGMAGENWVFRLVDPFLPYAIGATPVEQFTVCISYGWQRTAVTADIIMPVEGPKNYETILTINSLDFWGQVNPPASVLALIGYEIIEDNE